MVMLPEMANTVAAKRKQALALVPRKGRIVM
jgi:hypothetical protein